MEIGQEKPMPKKIVTRYNALENTLAEKKPEQAKKESEPTENDKTPKATAFEQEPKKVEAKHSEEKSIEENKMDIEDILSTIIYEHPENTKTKKRFMPLEGVSQQETVDINKVPGKINPPKGIFKYSPLLSELENEALEKKAIEEKNKKPWYKFW